MCFSTECAKVPSSLRNRDETLMSVEKEIDVRLSTQERYVEALGGKLEIQAVFDDADIKLSA